MNGGSAHNLLVNTPQQSMSWQCPLDPHPALISHLLPPGEEFFVCPLSSLLLLRDTPPQISFDKRIQVAVEDFKGVTLF